MDRLLSNQLMEIHCITDVRASLGESPVWSESEGVVYWIDILEKHLHRTDPSTRETTTWSLPSHPGMIALREAGGLVIALQDGLYSFDQSSAHLECLAPLEADIPDNRPNDGKVDADGRLWLGTMNLKDASKPTGNLYRIDHELTVAHIDSGYCVPNGLTWSPDDRVMYHTDTRSGIVNKYAFDRTSGQLTDKRDFFQFDRGTVGGVDGASMDSAGGYWAAFYGGWKIARISPSGGLDAEILLPVSQPTMPTFGGPNRSTIFITSARQKLDSDSLVKQPLAGALFAVTVEHQGRPDFAFRG